MIDFTEIVFLLDRSRSMNDLKDATLESFNEIVRRQSDLGKTLITTVLFDHQYQVLHRRVKAEDVLLTSEDYHPRGSTALLDALGKTILDVAYRMMITPERDKPKKVIFIIITDGGDNSSRHFTYGQIQNMIEYQRKTWGWKFIFLGASLFGFKATQLRIGGKILI